MCDQPGIQHLLDLALDLVLLEGRVTVRTCVGGNRALHQSDRVVILAMWRKVAQRREDVGEFIEQVDEWSIANALTCRRRGPATGVHHGHGPNIVARDHLAELLRYHGLERRGCCRSYAAEGDHLVGMLELDPFVLPMASHGTVLGWPVHPQDAVVCANLQLAHRCGEGVALHPPFELRHYAIASEPISICHPHIHRCDVFDLDANPLDEGFVDEVVGAARVKQEQHHLIAYQCAKADGGGRVGVVQCLQGEETALRRTRWRCWWRSTRA